MDLFNLVEESDNPTDVLAKIQCPVLVLGSQTDILFPIWQQKQLAEGLIQAGRMNMFDENKKDHRWLYFRKFCSDIFRIE